MAPTKALRLNHDSILEPTYGALFQISDQGQIQKDSSHLRESAIDAIREAPEIQRFAKIVVGVAEKTHERHVTPNHFCTFRRPSAYAQIAQKQKAPLEGALRVFTDEDR